jgi:hypothetical protein
MTDFANNATLRRSYTEPEVWTGHESKAFPNLSVGTKVTFDFGPASAIISFDCVIP